MRTGVYCLNLHPFARPTPASSAKHLGHCSAYHLLLMTLELRVTHRSAFPLPVESRQVKRPSWLWKWKGVLPRRPSLLLGGGGTLLSLPAAHQQLSCVAFVYQIDKRLLVFEDRFPKMPRAGDSFFVNVFWKANFKTKPAIDPILWKKEASLFGKESTTKKKMHTHPVYCFPSAEVEAQSRAMREVSKLLGKGNLRAPAGGWDTWGLQGATCWP